MQFLWKYVDDMVGKGLPSYIIAQLLFYASASMVPLAMPLAVLLSSIMTLGTLGEHYELTSMKSAGMSLMRIIAPLIGVSIFLSAAALAFANYALPVANLKFGSLLYDIRQQRPALNIREGVFYNEIDGYSIRVGKKEGDNRTIHDILIYDHTSGRGNDNVITADKGAMYLTSDKRYMVLELYDGHQFEEMSPTIHKGKNYEQVRVAFKEWKKVFDLSEFNLTRTDENLFKDNYQMQNLKQLTSSMDTIRMQLNKRFGQFQEYTRPYLSFSRNNLDSLASASATDTFKSLTDSSVIYSRALSNARSIKGYATISEKESEAQQELLIKYKVEWQRKFTLSVACFVLFLIGAPLGAIIRKGGLGLPFVVSVFFFVIFYVLSIMGEKFAKQKVMTPFEGMWFSTFILLPLSVFLVYKATNDSMLFNAESYIAFFKKIFQKLQKAKK